jgi:4a-hydroxytetrahydrobiopterin dehydratase
MFYMKQTIEEFVASHLAWTVSGETLVGNWQLAGFDQVKPLVVKLCDLADSFNHHPEVTFGYNTIQVTTTTHDAGNTITEKDIELAERVCQLMGG